jgi:hypothetical protein
VADPCPKTWLDKTEALRDMIAWASGVCGDWKFKAAASGLPDDNVAWFELRMGRINALGIDETRYTDNIDPVTGLPDVNSPRKDTQCGQRVFGVEARFFNRDQEQDVVAWVAADRTRSRLRMGYAREEWLDPNVLSIVEIADVFAMPNPTQAVQMRWQSEALFEMSFATVIAEDDDAAVGSWIESVEISSTLRNPGGVPLDPAVQLNNEVMP